jgi:hypothetical protein
MILGDKPLIFEVVLSQVPPEMVPTTAKKDTVKEAMRVGEVRMKKAASQQLRQKFNLATFDGSETIKNYALRHNSMTMQLTTLG